MGVVPASTRYASRLSALTSSRYTAATLRMREWLEYAPVWLLVRTMGALPRPLARALGKAIGRAAYSLWPRLKSVGERNLRVAFPDMPAAERRRILKMLFATL